MRTLHGVLFVSILTACIGAQSVGPDVTVSSLTDVEAYGQANGITAFAVGTVACNVGTQPVLWIAGNNQHPVIGQNMYRYSNGVLQQIGMSWLKHGFVSTNSPGCGSCVQPPMGGAQLGVGCTDAYGAGLNGWQQGLGPRSAVNATTGAYPMPFTTPTGNATIAGRVQVANADLAIPGAIYLVEAQYVTADDAMAGNDNNNTTWQQIASPPVGAVGNIAFTGPVHSQQPAIYAWQLLDPTVVITTVDIPQDGRFHVAKKVTALGGGNYRHDFAVFNQNSDRSGGKFTVNFPAGTVISNPTFRSVPYHSGEPYSSTPWTPTIANNVIEWATQSWLVNPNANALRWMTMYSFSCEANAAAEITKTLEPFKPAAPCTTQFTSPQGPGSLLMEITTCPAGVNKAYFTAVTTAQGLYPNGWLFGVDIPLPDLMAQIQGGYPFSGPLDAAGKTLVGPFTGLPSGVTIYSVTMNTQPGLGSIISVRPATSYTIP
jgi:hypothetical protein